MKILEDAVGLEFVDGVVVVEKKNYLLVGPHLHRHGHYHRRHLRLFYDFRKNPRRLPGTCCGSAGE